ncbi:LysR substrate-binding domain-containing protein [Zavarzinia compransoris]|uniref:LysR family transcriptional regulator n=1 Tax=Zavarzinia compransoris TaxID=1264899 RepID=A0A317E9J1_9PROT|nr:LysR substrate-binding domain-containing protein [Zavarzinia compransoris]PWR23807.1 LysR family transcriptional regulator [Zavarzinia compransoris]TDP48040.1 LysR family transcriptional regulator [Zavarzinia compransoris]
MDKFRAMATFVQIVDAGSLTAAAAATSQSPTGVVRLLAALEAALGVRLLNRTTRRLALTDEGRDYLARCRRILADVEDAEHLLSARQHRPAGRLSLTAPVMFGRRHVVPVVNEFLAAHPDMQVQLLLLDRVVDLLEEGMDLALRIGGLAESSMVALPLGATRQVVVASPRYLDRYGQPQVPADLGRHRCLAFDAGDRGWSFEIEGERRVVPIAPVLGTNQVDAALDACLQGLGCTRLLHYQVAEHLAAGRLVRLLRAFERPAVPIHLAYPQKRLMSLRVRAFIDFARPRLRAAVPGDDGARIAPAGPGV